jgi:hypothetical protein
MAREKLLDQQPAMDGGLNSISDDVALLPTQLRKAGNARLTDFGAITKRGGTQRSSAALSANPVLNGFTWLKDGGTQEIMAMCNGTLRTTTYGTFPWTWASQTGTFSTSVAPSFAQFRDGTNDVVYIADGGLLNVWDGTAVTTDIAGTLAVNTIAVHNERLWGCGNTTYPDSIFYSDINNGSTLGNGSSGGGQIIVRTFSDETVVGLASVSTSLLIFHRRGISRLTGYGQDDTTVAPAGITSDVGVIAKKSIVSIGTVAYFVSERGLYRCNEAEVAPVSSKETPDPLLPLIRSMTSAQFSNIRCTFNRATRELWIAMPGIGLYTYHTTLNAWTGPWDGAYLDPDTTAIWETLNTEGLPVTLRGDASGYVSLCDAPIALDNVNPNGTGGSAYTFNVRLRRMYCGDTATYKTLRWGYLTAQLRGSAECRISWTTGEVMNSYSLPFSFYGIWGGGYWGTSQWGTASSQSYRIPMGGSGYYIDINIIDSGQTIPVFSNFQLETFSLGRR